MGETLLLRMANTRVRSFKKAINAAKRLSDQDQLDTFAEELIIVTMGVPAELESGWSYLQKAAKKMSTEARVRTGQMYDKIAATWVTLTIALSEFVEEKVRDPHLRTSGLRDLSKLERKVTAIRDRTWSEWPWFSNEDVERSRVAEAGGELLDADEFFAQVAGISVREWRTRVAQREAGGVS